MAKSKSKRKAQLQNINFIRSAKIQLDLTKDQKKMVDSTIRIGMEMTAEYCECLLAMRGEPVYLREHEGEVEERLLDEKYWKDFKAKNLGYPTSTSDADLKELFGIICGKNQRREFCNPLLLNGCKAGQSGKETREKSLYSSLIQSGTLPFKTRSAIYPSTLRFQAFECATSYVASWVEANEAAKKQYYALKAEIESVDVSQEQEKLFNDFIKKTDLRITAKLIDKMSRFGFEVRYAAEELAVAQKMEPNISVWRKLFHLEVLKQQFERSRPYARFSMPCPKNHVRQLSYGHNYIPFTISYDGGSFTITTQLFDGVNLCNQQIKGRASGYFRDLKVSDYYEKNDKRGTVSKNKSFKFEYRRGNNSILDESMTGIVKEIFLIRQKTKKSANEYYFVAPLNCEAERYQAADDLKSAYMLEPGTTTVDVPKGTILVSADMGVNPFWSIRSYCWDGKTWKHVTTKKLGCVKDQKYVELIRQEMDLISLFRTYLDYLKVLEKTVSPEEEEGRQDHLLRCSKKYVDKLSKLRNTGFLSNEILDSWPSELSQNVEIARKVAYDKVTELSRSFRKLKDFHQFSSRKTGISNDQFVFLSYFKSLISAKKSFHYRGMPTTNKFAKRSGFESLNRYYASLKIDLQRKISQALVYEARLLGAHGIIVEELEDSKSVAKKSRRENELWALWSPLTMKNMIAHFCQQYGLMFCEVDPKLTSQYDPLTKKPGYRSKEKKSDLYVNRDGIFRLDADSEAAAENIFFRFIDRASYHYQIYALWVENVEELGLSPCYLPYTKKSEKSENSKKVKQDSEPAEKKESKAWKKSLVHHVLERMYGTSEVLIDDATGKPITLEKNQLKLLKWSEKKVKLYRYGDVWLGESRHIEEVGKIKSKLNI